MPVKAKKTTKTEDTFQVKGDELLGKFKALIKEGNVRKITILDKDKHIILSLPLTAGVVGFVLAPLLSAVGAMAALLTDCTIKVDRK